MFYEDELLKRNEKIDLLSSTIETILINKPKLRKSHMLSDYFDKSKSVISASEHSKIQNLITKNTIFKLADSYIKESGSATK
jgi:hypothetical protein